MNIKFGSSISVASINDGVLTGYTCVVSTVIDVKCNGSGVLKNSYSGGTISIATSDEGGSPVTGVVVDATNDIVNICHPTTVRKDCATAVSVFTVENLSTASNTTKCANITFVGANTGGTPKTVGNITIVPEDVNYDSSSIGFDTISGGTVTRKMTLNSSGLLDVPSSGGAGGFISSGNYCGTGCAAYFSEGLHTRGTTNWLYGVNYFNSTLCSSNSCWSIASTGVANFCGGITGVINCATTANKMRNNDTRGTDINPFDCVGASWHLKCNPTDGLDDGGGYHGILNLAQWIDGTGGRAHQLAFTDNDNIWTRGYSTTWSSWKCLIDSSNISGQSVNNSVCAGGLPVNTTVCNTGTNSIVRTDASGYIRGTFFNSICGDQGNASNPPRVWGVNGSDSFMRTYNTSALCVCSATTANNSTYSDCATYSERLWSSGCVGTYYVCNCWSGTYWCLKNNQGGGVAACYSDCANCANNSSSLGGTAAGSYSLCTHVHGCINRYGCIGAASGCVLVTGTNGCIGVASTVAPSSHVHGSINNGGCIGTASGCVLVTTTSGCITTTTTVASATNADWATCAGCATNASTANNSICLGGQVASYYTPASCLGNYLPLTGGDLSGTLCAPAFVASTFNCYTSNGNYRNVIIAPDTAKVAQSPIGGLLWHDVFGFAGTSHYTVTYETYNGTWNSATLDKRLFSQKTNQSIQITDIGNSVTAARWTFNSVASNAMDWVVIGHAWNADGNPSKTVLIETSIDAISWTPRHISTYSSYAQPIWHYVDTFSGDDYMRITITHQGNGGDIRLSSMKALTSRWGDQGRGHEDQYPYNWDECRNMTIYGTLSVCCGINGFTNTAGISGSNFDISGVNQITINDPGDGIVWASGTCGNITLATIDDATDNILNLSGIGASLAVNGNTVWHCGNDGSGSGLDSDLLEAQHGSYYLAWDNFTGVPSTFTPSSHMHGCICNGGCMCGAATGCVLCTTTSGCITYTSTVANATNASTANNALCLGGTAASSYSLCTHTHGCVNRYGCMCGAASGCVLCTTTSGCITYTTTVASATSATNATCLNGQAASYYATAAQINSGNLTTNNVLKWGGSSLCNSNITDNGTTVTVGSALQVNGETQIACNVTIIGDLNVSGTTTTVHQQSITTEDNIITVNYGETGGGVTSGCAGIQVDRGTCTDYQFLFIEADDEFKIGQVGDLQPVVTRGALTTNYIPLWNGTAYSICNSIVCQNGTNIALTSGGCIYGDTTTPYIQLNNASGTRLAYSSANMMVMGSGWSCHKVGNVDIAISSCAGMCLMTNDLCLKNTLFTNQENLDVDTGSEVVASVDSRCYDAAFFDYVVKSAGGTDLRAGTVYAVTDGTNVEYAETFTSDIGDTADVVLCADLSGVDLRLVAVVVSDNWIVKSLVRGL